MSDRLAGVGTSVPYRYPHSCLANLPTCAHHTTGELLRALNFRRIAVSAFHHGAIWLGVLVLFLSGYRDETRAPLYLQLSARR